jgi:hypothetical protein
MTEITTTLFSDKCQILAELWLNYRDDPEFEDFLEYNDLGLPIAYALANSVVKSTEMAEKFVEETFDLLLASLEIEDEGWESLDEMLSISKGV